MNSNEKNVTVYFDMDGVTARWEEASLEELFTEGFFLSRKPVVDVISAVEKLQQSGLCSVYILSSVVNEHAEAEKREWNQKYMGFIPEERQIYVPYGSNKSDFLPQRRDTDILVDDFSKNLHEWHGVGVKLLNGINWTKGTWKGHVVNGTASADIIYQSLCGLIGEIGKQAYSSLSIELY